MPPATLDTPHPTNNTIKPQLNDNVQTQEMTPEHQAWIKKAADVCAAAAGGNLEVRLLNVDAEDDLARMIHAINSLLDYTDAFVREAKAVLECSAQGKFFRRVLLRGMNGAFNQASTVINSASQAMQLKSEELDAQDATRLRMADEFDTSVKEITTTVAATAQQMQSTSTALSRTAQQTSGQSSAAMEASTLAFENVRNVADSTGQLQDAVSKIDEQVQESSQIVHRAVAEANQAKEIVAGLEKSSINIDSVVETIQAISKQTELLSLNAAIEAARAGDAGLGFAVVAAEVRKLSEETRSATRNAKREISSVQVATNEAVEAISQFGETVTLLNETTSSIAESVSDQRQSTGDINSNVTEVANHIEGVSENIRQASSAADETSHSAETMLESANDLSGQANTLTDSVEQFLTNIRSES